MHWGQTYFQGRPNTALTAQPRHLSLTASGGPNQTGDSFNH
jgi:hypothetical protein